jgi:hypothetical protein
VRQAAGSLPTMVMALAGQRRERRRLGAVPAQDLHPEGKDGAALGALEREDGLRGLQGQRVAVAAATNCACGPAWPRLGTKASGWSRRIGAHGGACRRCETGQKNRSG